MTKNYPLNKEEMKAIYICMKCGEVVKLPSICDGVICPICDSIMIYRGMGK